MYRIKLIKRNNTTKKLELGFEYQHDPRKKFVTEESAKYLCGTVHFQLQVQSARCISKGDSVPILNFILSARYFKLFGDDNLRYSCHILAALETTGTTKQENTIIITDCDSWHQMITYNPIGAEDGTVLDLSIEVEFDLNNIAENPFHSMYEDTILTDFELCGENGFVPVHAAMIAGVSPVLKTMLYGDWKENNKTAVCVCVQASKETLENFKKYIYLKSLPDTGIEELLLLAMFYMIPNLVHKCIVKLVTTLTSENINLMIEFAVKNQVPGLLDIILLNVQNWVVRVKPVINFLE